MHQEGYPTPTGLFPYSVIVFDMSLPSHLSACCPAIAVAAAVAIVTVVPWPLHHPAPHGILSAVKWSKWIQQQQWDCHQGRGGCVVHVLMQWDAHHFFVVAAAAVTMAMGEGGGGVWCVFVLWAVRVKIPVSGRADFLLALQLKIPRSNINVAKSGTFDSKVHLGEMDKKSISPRWTPPM